MDVTFVPIPGLHIADYVIIAIFLCICMGIGVYYGYQTNKNPSLENYFFGNRRLMIAPVTLSLFVTFISAIAIMGIPADIYKYGIPIIFGGAAYSLSIIIASLTIVPLLYPLKLTSTYEVFYMGIALFAPALALQTVAGIPLWLSIVVIGLVCTIYTAIGGIRSVVWTDVFQCLIVFTGILAVIIKGRTLLGTRQSITEIATEGHRLDFFDFDPSPMVRHTTWGLTIGMTFVMLPNWCNQASVQRFSSLRSLNSAYKAFCLLIPVIVVFHVIIGYLGILIYSYYNTLRCDPVTGGFISNFNQIVPYFVLDVLRSLPGLSGVFISCLFSGALSTLSSGINALSANTVEDILGDYVKKSKLISQTLVAKLFVITYGLLVIGLAYGINSMSGSIIQMAGVVFGACGGPLLGLYFLGRMIPKANSTVSDCRSS
ncbi:sodium-dependent multivitamin transporter-like [Pecten maximus]|uniref:sodium-dependent multivitamin transporter-like n=1 Tax=Pecten maximus TaxID=6579 RepID=UPI001458DC11|nr:sodium-dependent multivitamin transporter-like [Pecten maximus]